MTTHIGFTGTRFGMSPAQLATVQALLAESAPQGGTVHHGDCVGADAELHGLARAAGLRVVIHPGPADDVAHQAGCAGDERREPMTHMRRNRAIVDAAAIMIAAPFEDEPQPRGGSWKTIEMARKALRRGSLQALYVVGRAGGVLDPTTWR
jgi:hypothetical protein